MNDDRSVLSASYARRIGAIFDMYSGSSCTLLRFFANSGFSFFQPTNTIQLVYLSGIFTARRYASAGYRDRNVSVRPSRAGIVSKRRKLAA